MEEFTSMMEELENVRQDLKNKSDDDIQDVGHHYIIDDAVKAVINQYADDFDAGQSKELFLKVLEVFGEAQKVIDSRG